MTARARSGNLTSLGRGGANPGVATAVGLQALHGAAPAALQRLLQEGALGQVSSVHAQASRARGLAARPVTRSASYTLDSRNGAGTREVLGGHLLGLVEHLVGIEQLADGRALPPFPATLQDEAGPEHVVTAPDTFAASGTLRGGGLLTVAWWDRDPAPGTRIVFHGTEGTAVLESSGSARPALSQSQMTPMRLTVTSAAGKQRITEPAESHLPMVAQNVAAAYERFIQDVLTGSRTSPGFSTAARLHELLDTAVPRTA